jgi:hypothetical protein
VSVSVSYVQGADLPDLALEWLDGAGSVVDFSSGWTFVLKLGTPGQAADVTKNTGITGAATSPNVTIAWATSNELNTLGPGVYSLHLTATRVVDSKQRVLEGSLTVKPAIT